MKWIILFSIFRASWTLQEQIPGTFERIQGMPKDLKSSSSQGLWSFKDHWNGSAGLRGAFEVSLRMFQEPSNRAWMFLEKDRSVWWGSRCSWEVLEDVPGVVQEISRNIQALCTNINVFYLVFQHICVQAEVLEVLMWINWVDFKMSCSCWPTGGDPRGGEREV